ncbi:hypothetical protein [Streptomyces sp. MNU89]|uniref:hypothetical protein n=1 Tax=Streptomyces sp. MNU89 TaxID=2560025 RepID=UPI001E324C3D|nr:hypothetical protein [Streptomyces sp. MNU89]MCC9741316.1 hypothetical protein [Streptomyces sp. MNU89]
MTALQELQHLYDAEMWGIESPSHAKIRHIHLHLSKTLGKLAAFIEPADHQEYENQEVDYLSKADDLSPVVADLLMHCAQIANLVHGSMGEFLKTRYTQNAKRFAPDSAFSNFTEPLSFYLRAEQKSVKIVDDATDPIG